jgi:hypothetical protein
MVVIATTFYLDLQTEPVRAIDADLPEPTATHGGGTIEIKS